MMGTRPGTPEVPIGTGQTVVEFTLPWRHIVVAASAFVCMLVGQADVAEAQCVLPYQLAGSQVADATQMMANFDALARCIDAAKVAGSTNAIQYNAGSGRLGGVGPLTDGQVIIGSTGEAPKASRLTAGAGISIASRSGNVTISSTGSANGPGLYRQLLSATPTAANTGLASWLNQGSSTVTDSDVGLCIDSPTAGIPNNVTGRYMAVPVPPYTITALIAATRASTNYSGVGIGWYDGVNKLHIINYVTQGGNGPFFQIAKFSNPTTSAGVDVGSSTNYFSQPIWLQIRDDGANISFAFGQDGVNFIPLFATSKASGYLGASGYSNVIFTVNPLGGRTLGTIMSWTQD